MTEEKTLLIIDDEQSIRDALKQLFEIEGYSVQCFSSATPALKKLSRQFSGVVLCDINMPEINGIQFLELVMQFDSELPVVFLTGFADVEVAVKAIQKGAYDFFEKPVSEPLLDCIERALDKRRLVMENRELKAQVKKKSAPGVRILGETKQMQQMLYLLDAVIDTPADVLIEGETGTGKELVARYLHDHSERSNHNFVAINCGAIPEELIESELFGAKSGAFTGAKESREGKFSFAQGGTVFLDEIEAMSAALQVKLLRVLEERSVTPVGSNTAIALDIRVVAATKVDLQTLVAQGKFRSDLFYRLNLVKVMIPSLRSRKADIPLLYKHFSSIAATRFHKPMQPISPELEAQLLAQDWPGNVRELRNHAERHILLGGAMTASNNIQSNLSDETLSLAEKVSYYEQSLIEEALAQSQGSIKDAMNLLKVPRKTLYDKMSKYGLNRTMFTNDDG
ncbi:sigma-54-dependent Fis family transcriptional regulator [Pseudoalteromonas piscicida]|uniref:Sigma-54-dependent Fis family transcriptional regulator n=1 Tax=Pseudoalteromonas piscicida TaxID=43662 RepID=A0AAQ2ESH5_PSEO7|nr:MULTISPECIES: sigma-54 dependent transcriptional regulator [Pseudoalteromonas]MDP4486438.1 sigma-54 dependent transcriptional regulator [Pseudoalteromonas piscicida]TMN40709.1 sigma-54-dependent Fis family transcriptional regulator [Pseudoalteromonas piscicida]TMN43744.1 sigma-54-dependent Fis family transcriptional regulator [Pseudoalteromonas piscicida]TMN50796.1 sigma-54-dependent Fis family transcriptional regulator [Pseudoalteromonas piscicida]TMN57082.1 sigma-54-dependent Fis family t